MRSGSRWLAVFTVLLFLIATGSLVRSQVREKRVSPLPASETQVFEKSRASVGVAILVGVGKYPTFSGFGELRYPARDVDLLDKELTAQHYQVIPLTDGNATKESILNAIESAAEVIDPNRSTIVFFFSGHGYAQGGDNMLATSDASVTKLAQTGLSLKAVEQALIATKAQRRMLWVDACRNEPGKGVGDARSFTKFQAATGTRILFSTKLGRVSYEDDEFQQGVFSHYLVEGLRGAAAKDDGWVSFRDLSDYVTDQVQTRTLRQGHPQVPFEGTGIADASGDFPVARLMAGAAAPVPAMIDRGPRAADATQNGGKKSGDTSSGANLRVWLLPAEGNQETNVRLEPEGEPLGEISDKSDSFTLVRSQRDKAFDLVKRKPIHLSWSGSLNVGTSGKHLFVAALKLSPNYQTHAFGYYIYHRLLVDGKMVLDVQGNDINSAAADSILKSATVALDAGIHSVTVDLSVTWRGYSANPPYLLSPEAVTLDLRWKPVGSSEVVSLSPKSIATP